MAAVDGYAHRRRRDAHAVVAHDLLCLVDHLHFLFGVEIVLEDVDLRNEVERDLIVLRQFADGQYLCHGLFAGGEGCDLLLELRHALLARTGDRLIGRHDDAADLRDIVERLQPHDHDDGRAVRVRDDALVRLDRLGIDLGHDERHLRVHAEGTRVVDDDRPCLDGMGSKLLACRTARKERDVNSLKGVRRRLLHRVLLAHKRDFLPCGAAGCEQPQLRERELALLDECQEFLSDRTRCAEYCDTIFLHILPLTAAYPIRP